MEPFPEIQPSKNIYGYVSAQKSWNGTITNHDPI